MKTDKDFSKKFVELIEDELNMVQIYDEVKRINGEFVIRTCWKAQKGKESFESRWEGFRFSKV